MSWVLSLLLATQAGVSPVPGHRALVVAHNGADSTALAPLRFADDDGVKWAEVLERLGYDVTLLTIPDAETAAESSSALRRSSPPSLAEIQQAVTRIAKRNREDRANAVSTDTLLVYVGHGDVDEAGRSYLNLSDARLDRAALLSLVQGLEADFVHLILDACRAAGVVGSRGADPRALEQLRAALDAERMSRHPNLGVITAQTESGETHEWSRIRGGVFSHALRSGLLGGADVNLDGRVEYSELDAFLAAAFAGVADKRTQLKVQTRPPALDPRRALVGPPPPGPELKLGTQDPARRITIEDDRGTLLCELHRAASAPVAVRLPERPGYWIRTPEGEGRVAASALRVPVVLEQRSMVQRGPAEESLRRGLFAVAFDRSFYDGYVARSELVPVEALDVSVDASVRQVEPLGLEVGWAVQAAPLGANAAATGPLVGWRMPVGPLRLGLVAAYAVAPRAWLDERTLHRGSLSVALRYERGERWRLFGEASAGWGLVLAQSNETHGDLFVPTAQLVAGVSLGLGPLRLLVTAGISVDSVELDAKARWFWAPGGRISVEF